MSHVDHSHVCGKITSLPSSGLSIYTILGQLFFFPLLIQFVFFEAVKASTKETHGKLILGQKENAVK